MSAIRIGVPAVKIERNPINPPVVPLEETDPVTLELDSVIPGADGPADADRFPKIPPALPAPDTLPLIVTRSIVRALADPFPMMPP